MSLYALIAYLKDKISHAGDDQEQWVRLEKDSSAVHIITMHKGKGLEYPIVFLYPAYHRPPRKQYVEYQKEGRAILDFLKTQEGKDRESEVAFEEKKRLYYVAMTRAKAVLELPFFLDGHYPLSKLYKVAMGGGKEVSKKDCLSWIKAYPSMAFCSLDEAKLKDFEERKEIEESLPIEIVEPVLDAYASFPSRIDRIESFTRLFSEMEKTLYKDGHVEIGEGGEEKEDDKEDLDDSEKETRFNFSRGKDFGNFFHTLLETIDWLWVTGMPSLQEASTSTHPELNECLQRWGRRYFNQTWIQEHSASIREMLWQVLHTPLGQAKASFRLGEIPSARRIHEMNFYFRLRATQLKNISLLVWMPELNLKIAQKGLFTGSIDLLFEMKEQVFVVDWKTNALGPTREDYSWESCRQAMLEHRLRHPGYVLLHRRLLVFKKKQEKV